MSQKASLRTFLPECGAKLTYKLLCRLIDNFFIHPDYIPGATALLDAFEGSKVDIFVVPYSNTNNVFFELRYGDVRCKEHFSIAELTSIIKLAPFIAACAGQATPEPSELEELKARMQRIEDQLGISGQKPTVPQN